MQVSSCLWQTPLLKVDFCEEVYYIFHDWGKNFLQNQKLPDFEFVECYIMKRNDFCIELDPPCFRVVLCWNAFLRDRHWTAWTGVVWMPFSESFLVSVLFLWNKFPGLGLFPMIYAVICFHRNYMASQKWLGSLLLGEREGLRNRSSKTDFDQTKSNSTKNVSFLSD